MTLLAWLCCCTVISVATARRPVWGVVVVLVLWTSLPALAAGLVTGATSGPRATHPATWLALALLTVQLVTRPRAVGSAISRRPLVWLSLALVASVAVVTTVSSGGSGLRVLADQVAGPLAVLLILTGPAMLDPRAIDVMRWSVLGVATLQSLVAMAQFATGSVLLFAGFYANQYWFDPLDQSRWMGTTDHPLVLSTLVVAAAPLTLGLRRSTTRLAVLGLLAGAAAVTQSRTGVALVALVIVYVVVRARTGPLQKLAALAVVGVAGWYVAGSVLAAGINERLANDTGSTAARGDALTWFFQTVGQYALVGDGAGSSYEVARSSGLITSLENPVMMYAIDYGLVASLLFFGAQVWILLTCRRQARTPGLAAAAALAVLVQLSYSSVGAANAVGTIVWLLLGLLAVDAGRVRVAREPTDARATARVPVRRG